MTWLDFDRLLQAEQTRLTGHPRFGDLVPPGVPDQEFLEYDRSSTEELNSACKQFARHGTWPTLSGAARMVLWFRLELAINFCASLQSAQLAPLGLAAAPPADRAKVLRFLLVTLWGGGAAQIHCMIQFLQPGGAPTTTALDFSPN